MTPALDLESYFDRIHWSGQRAPTLDVLSGLLLAHMSAIPFENLDVLLGRPVRLDLQSLQNKLVRDRRGGYCFEHATLLAAVLEQVGFGPVRHIARVTLFSPREASPRTHMFLTVALPEGTFVVDPGFGALASPIPLPLTESSEPGAAPSAEVSHRMVRDGRFWVMQARTGGKMVDAWFSPMEPENPVDFEVGNHFTATHPDSPFVNRIMMRALTPGGRVTVMNRDLTTWQGDTPSPGHIADRAALRALLVEHFGFDLPEVEQLRVPAIPEWM
ncbi:MAG: arylamine N-acetyltransferase [Chloroflexi bacterium]|nr:arylamine N-acetyltransferase [Chloroflexota bacterium]